MTHDLLHFEKVTLTSSPTLASSTHPEKCSCKLSLISFSNGTVFQNNQIACVDEEKIFLKKDECQLVNVKGMM